jgi:hypothetical protein
MFSQSEEQRLQLEARRADAMGPLECAEVILELVSEDVEEAG